MAITRGKKPPSAERAQVEAERRDADRAKYHCDNVEVFVFSQRVDREYPPGDRDPWPKLKSIGVLNGDVRPYLTEDVVRWCRLGDKEWQSWGDR